MTALYVLAACKFWPHWSHEERTGVEAAVRAAAGALLARTSAEGLYDIRHADANPAAGGAEAAEPEAAEAEEKDAAAAAAAPAPLAVSTLRQAQALAALRSAGRLLFAEPFLGGAERLRRGLFQLYLPRDEATDGAGPFDLGKALAPGAAEGADAAAAPPAAGAAAAAPALPLVRLRRVRALTIGLPLLLLFLEHRDLPAQVVLEVAEAAAALAVPVGRAPGAARSRCHRLDVVLRAALRLLLRLRQRLRVRVRLRLRLLARGESLLLY